MAPHKHSKGNRSAPHSGGLSGLWNVPHKFGLFISQTAQEGFTAAVAQLPSIPTLPTAAVGTSAVSLPKPSSPSSASVAYPRRRRDSACVAAMRNRGGVLKVTDEISQSADSREPLPRTKECGEYAALQTPHQAPPESKAVPSSSPFSSPTKMPGLDELTSLLSDGPSGSEVFQNIVEQFNTNIVEQFNTNFVGQLDEFLGRGESRTPKEKQKSLPCSAVASRHIEGRLATWISDRDAIGCIPWPLLDSSTAAWVRFTGLRASDRSPALWEMSLVWHGVELFVVVESLMLDPESGAVGDVATAWTDCPFEGARQAVAAALKRAALSPLEKFLDALLEAWVELLPQSRSKDLRSRTTVEDHEPRSSDRLLLSPGRASDHSEDDEGFCEEQLSFQQYLEARPPLFRFDAASRGLAWDYPPTKSEKRELLLLQLFAESSESQAQIEALRARIPATPSATSRRSSLASAAPRRSM